MRIISWISTNGSHTNLGGRHISVRALGEMHIEPETVVPLLITKVSDPEPVVRSAAVEALGKFGRQAHAAVPALLEALQDPYEPMRRTVTIALNAIGAKALTNALGTLQGAERARTGL